MPDKKLTLMQLLLVICGIFTVLFGIRLFYLYILMALTLQLRMVLMIATQWTLLLVPGILMIANKESLGYIGITKKDLSVQLGIGALLALIMSLVLTIFPIVLGFKDIVGTTTYTEAWKFAYQFVYSILGVALAEELIFRGYIFYKLLEVKNSKRFAIIISSLLFGLFHIFNGNIIQVFVTAVIGFILCIFREKIKGCTLLSLIVAHGVYDALITIWVSLL